MYIVTGSDKLLQSCRQLSQHLTYYSKGAVALLLKLCTDEKLHKQSLKKPNSHVSCNTMYMQSFIKDLTKG